jgi:hypothetical protein
MRRTVNKLENVDPKSGHAKRSDPLLHAANARASQYIIDLIDRVNSQLPDPWSDQVLERKLLGKDCGGESLENYRRGKSPGDVTFFARRLADALSIRMIDADAFNIVQRDGGDRATLPLRRLLARAKCGERITPVDIEDELAAFLKEKKALDKRANEEFVTVERAKVRLIKDLVALAKLTSIPAPYLERRNSRRRVLLSIRHLASVLEGLQIMIWEAQDPDLSDPVEFKGRLQKLPEFSFELRMRALRENLQHKAGRKGISAEHLIRFAEMVRSVAARHHYEMNGDLPDPDDGDEKSSVFRALAISTCRFKPIRSTAELNPRPSTALAK